ncbi:hypothetical protein K1719_007946 [Acacia pycnantha]|nr:hypothetical protein K1719_007946 [Acacia pycnantha]
MQYASIGWSVSATLGYAQAAKDKRVIACIGDGSFQVSAVQDISTMIRCGQRNIIIGTTPALLMTSIMEKANAWTTKVRTEDDLTEATATATGPKKDSLCFIEVFVHKYDTSKELLEWGSHVAAANCRPPNPQ